MSSDEDEMAQFLAETCPECGTPGPQRHLSTVSGCRTCMRDNPVPVHVPQRLEPAGWRVSNERP